MYTLCMLIYICLYNKYIIYFHIINAYFIQKDVYIKKAHIGIDEQSTVIILCRNIDSCE